MKTGEWDKIKTSFESKTKYLVLVKESKVGFKLQSNV